jgi:hypothetical protein
MIWRCRCTGADMDLQDADAKVLRSLTGDCACKYQYADEVQVQRQ